MGLYHVTYRARLEGISKHGLTPGHPRAIGTSVYDSHRKGRVFLSEGDGIRFWFGRAEDFANHATDTPLEDLLVPVVLYVTDVDEALLFPDEIGTKDSGYNEAFAYAGTVSAEDLLVWDGQDWIPVGDWQDIDPEASFDQDQDEDEDGEIVEFHTFKLDNPLLPPEEELG